ncbi:hypothetical protein BS47DRAFT_1355169 [Hydnum rufescens UP504]|uniref:Uncharacterized protein n=1 Tax=Hydnum rufescens UP504 TaxID=1448309 RepID=A0A9P6AEV5_9AGAM|nr:hypothetical protein BS47DRAFT_1355169 [Hydnum rufescens UP504]
MFPSHMCPTEGAREPHSSIVNMTSSIQSQFDKFAFGIDVDDNYRIVQFVKPSPEFDISHVGTLKIPEGQPKPYDECLRLHFHYCLRMYVSCLPPGVQGYSIEEIEGLQAAVGMFERDEDPPPLDDPIWDSDLGREVL